MLTIAEWVSFQDLIRNFVDATVLSSPYSQVVSLTKSDVDTQQNTTSSTSSLFLVSSPHKNCAHIFGINDLDSFNFTYNVTKQFISCYRIERK